MKKFHLFKAAVFSAMFGLLLTACNDPLNETIKDAQGNGSAAGLPTVTVGNGFEVTFFEDTVVWSSDTCYILDGFVRFFRSELTIEPGTVILGLNGAGVGQEPGTLVIERNSRIFADGTPNAPIVFTSSQAAGNRAPGDWGGIIIAGQAYVNTAANAGQGTGNYQGFIEGVPSGISPITFGSINSDPAVNYNHSSGSLSYVRVEYAGNILSEGDETNGITLGGVGAGTNFHHIQVSFGSDDGIEWFGGTVDQHHIIAYRNSDDDLDTDQGYYGRTQFAFILRDPDLRGSGSGGSRALESNGDEDNAANTDEATLADPAYSNITIVGPMGPVQPTCDDNWNPFNEYNDAIVIRDESQLDLMNSVVAGFPRFAINMDDPTDLNAGGIPAAYVLRNRLVYDRIINAANTATNFGNGVMQVNNQLRAVNGCNDPAQDVAGKSGLKRAAWRLPEVDADPQTDFTIVASSPLAGTIGPDTPKFTSTRFVNFLGTPYKGIQDNDTFWDKTVGYRGASDEVGTGWDLGGSWIEWTPNDNAY